MTNIAIITIKEHPETFIQKHLDLIQGNIHHLYNKTEAFLPTHAKVIRNKTTEILVKNIKNNLINTHIDIVIAEYGMLGAEITPYARDLNIPLLVFFMDMMLTKNNG